jgi:hypothetical protein
LKKRGKPTRTRRYSEEQLIGILQRVDAVQPVADVCCELGIIDAAYYQRKPLWAVSQLRSIAKAA